MEPFQKEILERLVRVEEGNKAILDRLDRNGYANGEDLQNLGEVVERLSTRVGALERFRWQLVGALGALAFSWQIIERFIL